MATVVRSPVANRSPVPHPGRVAIVSQSLVTTNGLTGLFPQASPFSCLDWPNPRGRQLAVNLRTHAQAAAVHLIGQDSFFGLAGSPNFDWPNPRGRTPGITLRDGSKASPVHLVGQDQFFGLAGSPTFDWPNPRGKAFPLDLRTFLNQTETQLIGQDTFFAAAGMAPRYDYPNPLRRQTGQQRGEWGTSSPLLTAVLAVPFSLTDWPNPQRRKSLDHTWQTNVLPTLLSVIVQPPFYVTDWPNPRGRRFATSLHTWTDPLKLNLLSQDQFFAAPGIGPQYDYPNPRGRRPQQPNNPVNLLPLTVIVAANPIFQTDWPNPRRRRDSRHLLGFSYFTNIRQLDTTIPPSAGTYAQCFSDVTAVYIVSSTVSAVTLVDSDVTAVTDASGSHRAG